MAPMNYLQVVIAWLADVMLLDHDVIWTEILGTILILLFTFLNTLNKSGAFFCFKNDEDKETD